jgi:hypothetical protein
VANSNTKRGKKGGNELVCERIGSFLTLSDNHACNDSDSGVLYVERKLRADMRPCIQCVMVTETFYT